MAAGQINIRMSAMLISGSLPSSCIPLVSALQGLGFMFYIHEINVDKKIYFSSETCFCRISGYVHGARNSFASIERELQRTEMLKYFHYMQYTFLEVHLCRTDINYLEICHFFCSSH